jgi:hypothetical protein
MASHIPVLGPNFSTVTELAVAADEVASGSARPLLNVSEVLSWDTLGLKSGKLDVTPLRAGAPAVLAAANTLELTYHRLRGIDASTLMPEVATELTRATARLGEMDQDLKTAADAAVLLPNMVDTEKARHYLILVQNSAEVRATGGLPGALALVRVEHGTVELIKQSSGSAMGVKEPALKVDPNQTAIFSARLGKFISDVNLTPDFPTAAKSAKLMWEARYGGSVDGVLAIDPIVLAHLLEASGPISMPADAPLGENADLPRKLTAQNVIPTLLSDVYQTLDSNQEQDAYFALASERVFAELTSGMVKGSGLVKAVTRSYEEDRIRLWSNHVEDQNILDDISLGGSVTGISSGGAAFGVYFNDGTGAKMDYYVKRQVQLTQECATDGYSQYTVRVRLHNTAPPDAGTTLPLSVTGGGRFGTPPGSVQTNTVVYGPAQGLIDTVRRDGKKVNFGSYVHSQRPVGVITTRLAPGASTDIQFSFVKVVQATNPTLVVTPTIQPADDVTLPVKFEECSH